MTWIRLEDTVPDHDRLIRAGDRAAWLWVAGLCWSSRHLADGKLPYDVVPRLAGQDDAHELAARLVDVGLWRRTKTGFTIHNYSTFQRTKAQVDAVRVGAAERQKKARVTRKSQRDGAVTHTDVTAPDTEADTDTDSPQPPEERGAKNDEPSALRAVPDLRAVHRAKADPQCVSCQGEGWRYHAGAGRDAPCHCTRRAESA